LSASDTYIGGTVIVAGLVAAARGQNAEEKVVAARMRKDVLDGVLFADVDLTVRHTKVGSDPHPRTPALKVELRDTINQYELLP
jgi:hypothetical protein